MIGKLYKKLKKLLKLIVFKQCDSCKPILLIVLLTLCGCAISDSKQMVVIGDHQLLPSLTFDDEYQINIYESVSGALVSSKIPCEISIQYSNVYTNSYFGIVDKTAEMKMDAVIQPISTNIVNEVTE